MQKKSLALSVAMLCTAFCVNAQTEKGAVCLGGSVSVTSYTQNPAPVNPPQSTLVQMAISPSVAWAYNSNHFQGISLAYQFVASTDPSNKYFSNSVQASFFLRQYKPFAKNFYLFLQETAGPGFGYTGNGGYNQYTYAVLAALSPGVAYNLSKHLQLELDMQNLISVSDHYNVYLTAITADNRHDNNFSLNSSIQNFLVGDITFGIRYYR